MKPGALKLEVVEVGDDGPAAAGVLIHDETDAELAQLLVKLEPPAFPVAFGVIYCDPAESYEAAVHRQTAEVRAKSRAADLAQLMRSGPTWTVS